MYMCVCVFRSPETLKPVYTLHAKMEKSNREVWDILVHAGLYTVYVIGAVQIFYRASSECTPTFCLQGNKEQFS